jgi:hypothetical protein
MDALHDTVLINKLWNIWCMVHATIMVCPVMVYVCTQVKNA